MAEADVIVEGEYATSAQVQHALEPHCAVAQWLGDELHAHVSTQGIWDARQQLARAFELDPDRVHVTCEFMGGGFGAKQGADDRGPDRRLPLARRRRPRRPRLQRPPQRGRRDRPSRADRSRPTASARAATGR